MAAAAESWEQLETHFGELAVQEAGSEEPASRPEDTQTEGCVPLLAHPRALRSSLR